MNDTMEQNYINGQQLSDFVETHNLMNQYSIVHFNAIVTITTANNKITNRQMEVMISFDNFNSLGQVTLMESDIDPKLYPTIFEANWQKMKHIENEYLLITDVHKKNPTIGSYTVKIIPLNKTRD
jgi:hypothetical protein